MIMFAYGLSVEPLSIRLWRCFSFTSSGRGWRRRWFKLVTLGWLQWTLLLMAVALPCIDGCLLTGLVVDGCTLKPNIFDANVFLYFATCSEEQADVAVTLRWNQADDCGLQSNHRGKMQSLQVRCQRLLA
eukprot:TRINITY_DN103321_c0_g1_i1.p1 TRINITY_DN103321_c0_g1~~TRINITY_DN103321_c0_g1_i1.p1  ORF type:complete len:130 (-),score=5.92 TRINITY_DN103321_c0_g1_i1:267-656(-)